MVIRFLAILLIIGSLGVAYARTPEQLLERDEAECDQLADRQYIWLFNMENWRTVYNSCMRDKLNALAPVYRRNTLEAMRLESECPEVLLTGAPVEHSEMGIQIVNELTSKELKNAGSDDNIEHHLLLYYQRLAQSQARIREVRRIQRRR